VTPPLFISPTPFEGERVHAVAIYCSDGRYGDAIDEFLHRHLGLPNYDRLTIPGGPAWLTYRSSSGLLQQGMVRDQLDFLVEAHQLRRAILIAHYGCAYYLRRHHRGGAWVPGDADSVLPTQLLDLRDATQTLRNWHPSLQVESYLARAVEGRVQFEAAPGP
jgi:hypothetical protein